MLIRIFEGCWFVGDQWNTRDLDAANYKFTPNPDFNGSVALNYLISDDKGGVVEVDNTITISPKADAPALGKLSGTGLPSDDQ